MTNALEVSSNTLLLAKMEALSLQKQSVNEVDAERKGSFDSLVARLDQEIRMLISANEELERDIVQARQDFEENRRLHEAKIAPIQETIASLKSRASQINTELPPIKAASDSLVQQINAQEVERRRMLNRVYASLWNNYIPK